MLKHTKKLFLIIVVLILPFGLLITAVSSKLQTSQISTLTAYESSSELTVDGIANEAVWGSATSIIVTTLSGGSAPNTAITFKAVFTTTYIYILASWADTTFSASRGRYEWNGTDFVNIAGSHSEDRLAIMWEITDIVGFDTLGCAVKCHSPSAYLGTGEVGDIWHLKAARGMGALVATNSSPLTINPATFEAEAGIINIIGVADDNVIDDVDRSGDSGSSPYRDNNNGTGAPAFIETAPVNWMDAMYLTEAEISGGEAVNRSLITSQQDQWYIANYTALGSIIPRHITSIGAGSRGDIHTGATWADGTWTVEIRRELNTNNSDDVAFDTNGGLYHFGVSLMDNSGGDADHSPAPVSILAFPTGGNSPGISGFNVSFILIIMFGAIGFYLFFKKRKYQK
ncbi:MAG: ethylbenzene dehydrogenase-related protein [Candidatus Thorarchaeota archaeon]